MKKSANPAAADKFPHKDVLLAARGLSFGYRRPLAQNLDLDIVAGEVHGIIGPNGTGKSTLLRTLAGLISPLAGEVVVGNRPLASLRSRDRARKISFLPQDTSVAAAVDTRSIVTLGRYAHQRRIDRFRGALAPTDREIIDSAMRRVGVEHLAERLVTTLSGGQRQLVLVAKLLAQQSQIMLFDEPTAALDLRYQLEILGLLRQLAAEGHGVAVVLHDLNLAARTCDRLSVLHDGSIARTGTPEEVVTSEMISEVYSIDSAIDTDPHTGKVRVTALPRGRPGRGL